MSEQAGDINSLPAVAQVFAAEQDLRAAKDLMEEAQNALWRATVTLGWQAQAEAGMLQKYINFMYWSMPDVSPTLIYDSVGLNKHQGKKLVNDVVAVDHPCRACGEPRFVSSRQQLNDLLVAARRVAEGRTKMGDESTLTCKECTQAQFAWRDERREAEWQQREARLRELRTMPYREYLRSPEWRGRRQQHLRSAGYRCQLCNQGETVLDVHHRTYERRGAEYFKDLIVLCRDCHAKFHNKVGVE